MQFAALALKGFNFVIRTFSPRDIVGGVATFVHSTGVPIADERLTLTQSRTPQGRTKTKLSGVFPIVQDVVVAGISRPTVVRTTYVDLTVTAENTASIAERDDAISVMRSFVDSDAGFNAITKLENLY